MATATVHAWLASGELTGRRGPAGRWCIPFPPETEATWRARIQDSRRLHRGGDGAPHEAGEVSIATAAAKLGVKPDVVYYWAKRGYLPTRRGQGGRRWITLTPELEQSCQARIANSYKLPEHLKATAQSMEGLAV